jgi:hypothetical protein
MDVFGGIFRRRGGFVTFSICREPLGDFAAKVATIFLSELGRRNYSNGQRIRISFL